MNYNENRVNISSILKYVLKQWKSIIAGTAVITILITAFYIMLFQNYKSYREQMLTTESSQELSEADYDTVKIAWMVRDELYKTVDDMEASTEKRIYEDEESYYDYFTHISNLPIRLNSLKSIMSNEQKVVYNMGREAYEQAGKEKNLTVETPVESGARFHVIYVIIGAMLGFIIMCAFHTVVYLLSDGVKAAEEIEVTYGLSLLGYIDSTSKGIAKWIQHGSADLDLPVQIKLIAREIEDHMDDKESARICICTSNKHSLDSSLLEQLKNELEMPVRFMNYHEVLETEMQDQNEYVVLWEKLDVSKKKNIGEELLILRAYNRSVLGYVVSC